MAALTLGLAMNSERMPTGGCAEHHCSGQSPAFTPQALILGAGGGVGRQSGRPKTLPRTSLSHEVPAPPHWGLCHRDSGLALTSLSRPCHIWLPGSPHGTWQD